MPLPVAPRPAVGTARPGRASRFRGPRDKLDCSLDRLDMAAEVDRTLVLLTEGTSRRFFWGARAGSLLCYRTVVALETVTVQGHFEKKAKISRWRRTGYNF
jgi:hypothetical protein